MFCFTETKCSITSVHRALFINVYIRLSICICGCATTFLTMFIHTHDFLINLLEATRFKRYANLKFPCVRFRYSAIFLSLSIWSSNISDAYFTSQKWNRKKCALRIFINVFVNPADSLHCMNLTCIRISWFWAEKSPLNSFVVIFPWHFFGARKK